MAVRVLKTDLSQLFWDSVTLRDHFWHRRDLSLKLAAIRHDVKEGQNASWGSATEGVVTTGPVSLLPATTHVNAQLEWLQHERPSFLLTYPSNVAELARLSIERKCRLSELREVRTIGEMVTPDLRGLCEEAWGVKVTDTYSTSEVGYIALQCPVHSHYHVQSESVLVEVVDDDGRPCHPGSIGRVLVTDLHNFAMPLVRYDIGDYAELGDACDCGITLPVLRRIVGRVRNMLITASGERYWPMLGSRKYSEIAPVVQHQLAQKELDLVELRIVTREQLSERQEQALRALVLSSLPPGMRLELRYCDQIARGAGGKFEDFVCELN
jgi:phenylacetate-CoA ligase